MQVSLCGRTPMAVLAARRADAIRWRAESVVRPFWWHIRAASRASWRLLPANAGRQSREGSASPSRLGAVPICVALLRLNYAATVGYTVQRGCLMRLWTAAIACRVDKQLGLTDGLACIQQCVRGTGPLLAPRGWYCLAEHAAALCA